MIEGFKGKSLKVKSQVKQCIKDTVDPFPPIHGEKDPVFF